MYPSSALIGLGFALYIGLSSAQVSYPPRFYNETESYLQTAGITDSSLDATSDWNEESTTTLADVIVTVTDAATTVYVGEGFGTPPPIPTPTMDVGG